MAHVGQEIRLRLVGRISLLLRLLELHAQPCLSVIGSLVLREETEDRNEVANGLECVRDVEAGVM